MKIDLEKIKNIDLCSENGHVNTIPQEYLLGIYIHRKLKSPYTYKEKPTYRIKTFEIALKTMNSLLSTDLAQLTINYLDNSFEHFFIVWGDDDYYDCSSLQKIEKKDDLLSLSSNCSSVFLK